MIGDNQVPYTENWDFDIQHQLPLGILIDVAYVGSHGVHLNKAGEGNYNINQLTPDAMALGTRLQQSVPNPFYKIITTGPRPPPRSRSPTCLPASRNSPAINIQFPGGGNSMYHSFQLKVEKRFSHGLTALLSFTGQKLIDDFSQFPTSAIAPADFRTSTTAASERAVSSNDRSRRLVISGTYEICPSAAAGTSARTGIAR